MLAFALSFDEVIVTTFTAGQQQTLPIWMLEELVRPRQRPVTNVVAIAVVIVTLIPILAAFYLTRDGDQVRAPANKIPEEVPMTMHINTEMLIGSKFVKGTETAEQVLNPKTGGLILELPEASEAHIHPQFRPPREHSCHGRAPLRPSAPATFSRLPMPSKRMRRRFARLEALNCGKPINAVLNDEIPAIVDCYRFFAGAVRTMPGQAAGEYLPGFTSMIRRDPVGVVGSIAPWNYPLMMMAWKLAPAIGGGNTVVFKPSEQTPLTALKMAKVLADILPEGVVNVVLGRGESVGNALINHPGINMISITGDVATGKKVLQAAAKSVKRTHLELGGKAPVIVFDDADIGEVVDGLRAFGFYNAGQDCTAACGLCRSQDLRQARRRTLRCGLNHQVCL